MGKVERVLVFCLPGIGDTLFVTPSFRALKEAFPGVRITALTMFAGAKALLKDNPHVDEVIQFDFLREGKWAALKFVLGLRKRRFDVCMLAYPSNRLEYNLMALLIGAPIRLGHRYKRYDHLCANWLRNRSVLEDDSLTCVEENLRLVELLSGRRHDDLRVVMNVSEEDDAIAAQWLDANGLTGSLLIGLHPGGSTEKNHTHKRWPPERFAELGRILGDKTDAGILVFGGPEEEELKARVAAEIGGGAVAVSLPNLMATCALIARCRHFVANDNALLHLASGLGVPTTAIFGPTCAQWVRIPGTRREEVALGLPCQPCFFYSPKHLSCTSGDFRCLTRLTAEYAAEHVLKALNEDHASIDVSTTARRERREVAR